MKNEIKFTNEDSIAIIAPHPDDECIGNAGILIKKPSQVDIYVISDGCRGNKERGIEDEARLRREWLENEMSLVKPRNWFWLGLEDTKIADRLDFVSQIDYTKYTKVFLPWNKSLHPDHRVVADSCINEIKKQNAINSDYYFYEICAPFHNPRYYIDITDVIDKKIELIKCHKEMDVELETVITLNRFRGAQLHEHPNSKYVEAYDRISVLEIN